MNIFNTDMEFVLRDKDADNAIVALLGGWSDAEIDRMLKKHPNWYRSTAEYPKY